MSGVTAIDKALEGAMFRMSTRWAWFIGIATVCANCAMVLVPPKAIAQIPITPDGTLPNNSIININGNIFNITGGTQAGGNLFHSFKDFSVPTGSGAFFNNTVDIQNIISRVTGGSVSNIDGLIRTLGTANLFLINPNGIVFGQNARLNVGGSFVASTANSLKFADGTQFSATAPQSTPLLTVSVPLGLQIGQTPGQILVQAASGPSLNIPLPIPIDLTRPIGLQVQPGKTLALLGGDVVLEGGNLTALGGRIELGSVAGGEVSLQPTRTGWMFGYEGIQNFQNIKLSQQASVKVGGNGGGDIQVQGRDVTLTNQSVIGAINIGNQDGRGVSIGSKQLTVADGSILGTLTDGAGRSGDLTIESEKVTIQNSFGVTFTSNLGDAGNLTVKAKDSIELLGKIQEQLPGGLSTSSTFGKGGASGNLTIETGKLIVRDGAVVAASNAGVSPGGDMKITATDSVELIGNTPTVTPWVTGRLSRLPVGLFTSTRGNGSAGNLEISTGKLIVRDGAVVTTTTFGTASGGNLIVKAADSVELIGSVPDAPFRGNSVDVLDAYVNNGLIASVQDALFPSAFYAGALGDGSSGNLKIETGKLVVQEGLIAVSAPKLSGDLEVIASSMVLDNFGALEARTLLGNGGNITLKVQDLLLLRRNSQISTSAGSPGLSGSGGKININTDFIVAVPGENSDITANAFSGRPGQIEINTSGLFGIQPSFELTPENDITAFSQSGITGEITINRPDVEQRLESVELPTVLADTSDVIDTGCGAFAEGEGNSFTITGRGGLPPSPYEPISTDVIWSDTRIPYITSQYRSEKPTPKPPTKDDAVKIVPATGWVFDGKGNVTLISHVSNVNNLRSTPACQKR